MWCGTRDGALLIINAESGRIQKVVRAHQKGGISVLRIFFFLLHLLDLEILAILGVGSWVMTGSADGWLKVWAADAQEARLFALCHKLFFCEMVVFFLLLFTLFLFHRCKTVMEFMWCLLTRRGS